MGKPLIGYILIGISALVVVSVIYLNSSRSDVPLVFSPAQLLGTVWREYKETYVEPSGRTVDLQRNSVTTSEGQSYTMLRAVWMGDKEMFDRAWEWTQDNLRRSDDQLFAWLYGERPDGTWGIPIAQGGGNTASDADQDIALALIFAYARWQDPAYLTEARALLADIWEHEVIIVRGTPYLAANNIEKTSNSPTAVLNPSYFAPYAYRVFALVDPAHPWTELAESSYDLLERLLDEPLGTGPHASLPPDWVLIHKMTGALSAPKESPLTTNFSYDALRMPWRLALDYQWFGEERAKAVLERMDFLAGEWESKGRIFAAYNQSGAVLEPRESPAMYGGTVGYFMVAHPEVSQTVYEQKLLYLYDPNANAWKEPLSYWDDNWAWFGIALYNRLLPNLSSGLLGSAYLP